MEKTIIAALTDESFLKKIAEILVEIIMPKIIDHLKELDLFNAEFCEDFKKYKTEQQKIQDENNLETARKIDQIEQYERLDSVRVFGVEEMENEDTGEILAKFFTKELKVKITKNDINVAHRLGAPSNDGKARPAIVKFVRREQRLQVLRARTALKGRMWRSVLI